MQFRFFLAALFLVAAMWTSPAWAELDKDVVPDDKTAIALADVYLRSYMGEEHYRAKMKNAEFFAEADGEIWVVYSYPRAVGTKPSQNQIQVMVAGGGPAIEICRKDGRVVDIYYMR